MKTPRIGFTRFSLLRRVVAPACGAVLSCALASYGFAQAAYPVAYWFGGDRNWGDAGNWTCFTSAVSGSSACVPSTGYSVYMGGNAILPTGTVTLNVDESVANILTGLNLTIPGTSLTAAPGNAGINISGTLQLMGGSITTPYLAANVLDATGGTITGGFTVTTANLANAAVTGPVSVAGTLTMTGTSLASPSQVAAAALDMTGGSITANTGGVATTTANLSGATINGPLAVNANASIANTTVNGALSVNPTFDPSVQGTLQLSGSVITSLIAAGTFTIANSMVTGSDGSSGTLIARQGTSSIAGSTVNNTAVTTNSGATLQISGATFGGNNGYLTTSGTTTLSNGTTVQNALQWQVNNGATLTLTGAGTSVTTSNVQGSAPSVVTGGVLNVQNGAQLADGGAQIATLQVGNLGTPGTVNIASGGSVTLPHLNFVAGTINVSGAGSGLNLGGVQVGTFGNGSLNISSGGVVTANAVDLGVQQGQTGNLTVSGAGSQLVLSNNLVIGDAGTSTVTLSDGGVLNGPATGGTPAVAATSSASGSMGLHAVPEVTLGAQATGSGTLLITGSGTGTGLYDQSYDQLNVGQAGRGAVTVQNVSVNATFLNVGQSGGLDGVLTTSGSGGVGYGQLTVAGNGVVNVGPNTGLVIQTSRGPDSISPTAQVNVNQGSWKTGSTLYLLGTLTVSNGGTAGSSTLVVNSTADGSPGASSAMINVAGTGPSGAASEFDFQGLSMYGSSSMTVSGGAAALFSGSVLIGDDASVTITGAGSNLQPTEASSGPQGITIGGGTGHGTAVVDVTQSGFLGSANGIIVGTNSSGQLNITNGGSVIAGAPGSPESSVLNIASGTVTVNTGGTLKANSINIGGAGAVAALNVSDTANVTGAGTVTVVETLGSPTTGRAPQSVSILNGGTLAVSNGQQMLVAGTVALGGGGVIDVRTGSLTIGTTIDPVIGPVAPQGSVAVNIGGVLSGGLLAGDSFAGAGTVLGSVVNDGGRISPGDPETFQISGSYTQTAGVLDLQIDGTGNGQFDQLRIGSSATFAGGTIDFDFEDGFAPTTGEVFGLLSALGGVSLANVDLVIDNLAPGFEFSFVPGANGNYDLIALNNGVYSADETGGGSPPGVPEPSTLSLLPLGILAVVRLARRRPERHRACSVA